MALCKATSKNLSPYQMFGLYNIPILAFAVASLVYFSLQLKAGDTPNETAYKLAAIGGNLCLFPVLVYMTFKITSLWMNQQFGRAIVYMCVLFTIGFAFSLYSLYHFSKKVYANKDGPQQALIFNGLGVVGSLATVLTLLPGAAMNLLVTLSIPVGILYFWYRDLKRAFKK